MAVCCLPFGMPNSSGVQEEPQTLVAMHAQEPMLQTVSLENCTKCSMLTGRIKESKAACIQPGQ